MAISAARETESPRCAGRAERPAPGAGTPTGTAQDQPSADRGYRALPADPVSWPQSTRRRPCTSSAGKPGPSSPTPQLLPRAPRRRRPRHRDDSSEAPLRRRREGAGGHRIPARPLGFHTGLLTWRAVVFRQQTENRQRNNARTCAPEMAAKAASHGLPFSRPGSPRPRLRAAGAALNDAFPATSRRKARGGDRRRPGLPPADEGGALSASRGGGDAIARAKEERARSAAATSTQTAPQPGLTACPGARAPRRRRPRHPDDPAQAPLRRRREGPAGHRVLTARRAGHSYRSGRRATTMRHWGPPPRSGGLRSLGRDRPASTP